MLVPVLLIDTRIRPALSLTLVLNLLSFLLCFVSDLFVSCHKLNSNEYSWICKWRYLYIWTENKLTITILFICYQLCRSSGREMIILLCVLSPFNAYRRLPWKRWNDIQPKWVFLGNLHLVVNHKSSIVTPVLAKLSTVKIVYTNALQENIIAYD